MSMETTFHEQVVRDFSRRQQVNPRYSLRGYARYLGVNPTSLCLFLKGKRRLSSQSVLRIAARLEVPQEQWGALVEGVESGELSELDLDRMAMVSDWYYFALLSLLETKDCPPSAEGMAARLGIGEGIAEDALARMERIGMVRRETNRWVATGRKFRTPDNISSYAVRRSHYQALELARRSLDEDPVSDRDFTAITVAMDPAHVDRVRDRIRKFTRRLSSVLEQGEKKEVYRMVFQLFPLKGDRR